MLMIRKIFGLEIFSVFFFLAYHFLFCIYVQMIVLGTFYGIILLIVLLQIFLIKIFGLFT